MPKIGRFREIMRRLVYKNGHFKIGKILPINRQNFACFHATELPIFTQKRKPFFHTLSKYERKESRIYGKIRTSDFG